MPSSLLPRTLHFSSSPNTSQIMPIITIFGATGTQAPYLGTGGIRHGRSQGTSTLRGAGRWSPRAVEVVKATFWDKESLKDAMRDSEAVFGNTNFWDPEVYPADLDGRGEITQGKNLVDAAKEVGVKFFIWSSLPSATKESKGLYSHVYHLDNKVVIDDYLKASGIPYAILQTCWFVDNLYNLLGTGFTFGSLQKTDTGYTIPILKYGPEDTQVATWVAHDFGAAAVALLTNYTEASKGVLGSFYPVVSMRFTYPQFAAAIAKALGKQVTFTPIETAGLVDFDEMWLFMANIGMYNDTPIPNPDLVALGVKFGSMEEFIQTEIVPRFA
ncbi:NAD(P)-binding protein [Mycena rebaudengoi]|nr:NAD(P)-binding protein [Mycena rebaudengoi]